MAEPHKAARSCVTVADILRSTKYTVRPVSPFGPSATVALRARGRMSSCVTFTVALRLGARYVLPPSWSRGVHTRYKMRTSGPD